MGSTGNKSTVLSHGGWGNGPGAGTPVHIGDVVAGYRLESIAGAGGMGVVFRATDPDLDRSVAVKVILPEFAADPAFRELFIRESLTAAALEHPNVIPVYRAGDEDGLLYIAMRFVEGQSLEQLIADVGHLPPDRAVGIVAQVADALDAAHARGLVHRDVKPANVMIADPGGEEHIYLTDFGLSVPRAESGSPGSGRPVGTPGYLAPEQIARRPVDGRADIYALGCVLFWALTGEAPDEGTDTANASSAGAIDPPPAVSTLAPNLPPDLVGIFRRAMAELPGERFPSAGALAAAATGALATSSGNRTPWYRRGRLIAAAAMTVAAASAVAGFALSRGGQDEAAALKPRLLGTSDMAHLWPPTPADPGLRLVSSPEVTHSAQQFAQDVGTPQDGQILARGGFKRGIVAGYGDGHGHRAYSIVAEFASPSTAAAFAAREYRQSQTLAGTTSHPFELSGMPGARGLGVSYRHPGGAQALVMFSRGPFYYVETEITDRPPLSTPALIGASRKLYARVSTL